MRKLEKSSIQLSEIEGSPAFTSTPSCHDNLSEPKQHDKIFLTKFSFFATTSTLHNPFSPPINLITSSVSTHIANFSSSRIAIMKLIAMIIGALALALSVSTALSVQYQQASRLVPHLAPRVTASQSSIEASITALSIQHQQASRLVPHLAPGVTASQSSIEASITRKDNHLKNFTHDELFSLQKKFLDNFIAPNNTIQVRSFTLDLRSIDL